jgi:hypothetical protein
MPHAVAVLAYVITTIINYDTTIIVRIEDLGLFVDSGDYMMYFDVHLRDFAWCR